MVYTILLVLKFKKITSVQIFNTLNEVTLKNLTTLYV